MSRFRRSLIATLVPFVPLVPLLATANAHAAAPVPFTITEQIDVSTDPFTLTLTFTATGPLCPAGSFTDDQVVSAGHPNPPGVFNAVSHDVYTCADGSGTFNALKLNHLTVSPGIGQTNAGEIQLHGGTGDYTSLAGHGVDDGTFSYQTLTGVGNISGTAQP